MASLLGFKPVAEGNRYFISYNRDDSHRIKPIAMELDAMGLPMWYDDGILHGTSFETEISKQIRSAKAVIMFITAGMFLKLTDQGVGWVAKEFQIARNLGVKLLPVVLDNINPRYVPDPYQSFWVDVSYVQGVPFNGDNTTKSIAQQIAHELGFKASSGSSASGAAQRTSSQTSSTQSSARSSSSQTSSRSSSTQTASQTSSAQSQGTSNDSEIRIMTKNGERVIDKHERKLSLENCGITDISPLAGMTQLSTLILTGNSISDITPLRGITSLCVLNLSGNNISDLSPLRNLTNLTWLFLSDNNITDLSPLSALTRLTNLELKGNKIANVMALGSLTRLTSLRLGGNPVSKEDVDWLDDILPNCSAISF